jgi:uncharacterized cupredoxin-like copper-binding protein
MRARWKATAAVLAALSLLAAGCGDDDDDDAADTSETTAAPEDDGGGDTVEGSASVSIDMVDFGYEVSGPVTSGVQTFETRNRGTEIHMMGIGRMKDGVTFDDVVAGLSEADGGEGEDAGGEEQGDPFEALFTEDDIGAPGQVLFPGNEQTLTLATGLEPGSYALVCFIPGEGDGVPHFAKGMLQELTVVDAESDGEAPEVEAEYTLGDSETPDGPDAVPAGEITIALTNDGEKSKDFIVAQLDEGKEIAAFDAFFEEMFEGEQPPPEGAAEQAPGIVADNTFSIEPGQTVYMTVTVTAGEWQFVSAANDDGEGEDEGDSSDDHVLVVTVG